MCRTVSGLNRDSMTCLLYEISRLLLRVVKVHLLKHVVYKRTHHNMYILDDAVQIYAVRSSNPL
jgi:hypothetical protein